MSLYIYSCERCLEYFSSKPYRVLSEEAGEKLLDMFVCYGCYIEATQLGLDTETVEIDQIALH